MVPCFGRFYRSDVRKQEPVDPLARERFGRVWPTDDGDGFPWDPPLSVDDSASMGTAEPQPVITREASGWSGPIVPVPPPAASALAALNPGRRAVKALAAVAAVVALIAGFVVWRSQPHAEMVAASTSSPAATATSVAPTVRAGESPTPPSSAATIVVAISGHVRRPGLVRLPADARVADAIAAAGGVLPGTDLSFVNLARKVSDGELIVIGITPSPGQTFDSGAADPSASGSASGGLVDINTATATQLDALPGIGPALAQRIIDYRTQHGAFRSVNQLEQVPGIGDSKFADIKDLVTI